MKEVSIGERRQDGERKRREREKGTRTSSDLKKLKGHLVELRHLVGDEHLVDRSGPSDHGHTVEDGLLHRV